MVVGPANTHLHDIGERAERVCVASQLVPVVEDDVEERIDVDAAACRGKASLEETGLVASGSRCCGELVSHGVPTVERVEADQLLGVDD